MISKVDLRPDHDISCQIFCAPAPSTGLDVLIMKFSGEYGDGSGGRGDARYMVAMTVAAIHFKAASAIIYDLRELTYNWGDDMSEVLSAHEEWALPESIPMAILVSDKCERAIVSLWTDWMWKKDLTVFHKDLDSAIALIDQTMTKADPRSGR